METGNKCCFTGYRPQKFPFSMSPNSKEYISFENNLIKALFDLADVGVNTFYCGMAMGFDILAGECVLLLKKARPELNIRLVCAIPFEKQSETFSPDWKIRYDNLKSNSDEIIYTSAEYSKGCYFLRNKFMVDSSDVVLTWFDGKSGGTKNTLFYAHSKNKKIINLYDCPKENLFSGALYYEYDENFEEDD